MKNVLLLLAIVLIPAYTVGTLANPQVKYCKNFTTGEVFVVEANMPCPYPTVEI